jgi:hypothetical protein
MKRVASAWSLAEIGHFRNVVEQAGIACFVKNEQLGGALGDVPFLECLPELWVYDDDDLVRAKRVIEELKRPAPPGERWRCRHCHEDNDAEFAACWNCGEPDGEPDGDTDGRPDGPLRSAGRGD